MISRAAISVLPIVLVLLCASQAGDARGAEQETLPNLILGALQAHPSIRSQEAQERAAQANVQGANYQFYPTPSISVEQVNTRSTDRAFAGDSAVTIARLQQPLWTGGRLTAGVNRAEAGVSVSRAALGEVRQQLALRVVQAYGDWLSAHLKTLANEESLAKHVQLKAQVERRIAEGAAPESDLVLAVSRLNSVAAEVATGRSQMEVAIARLSQLIGRRIDAAAMSAMPAKPRTWRADAQELLREARSLSASVQKAEAQARVQEAAIAERRADLYPELFARFERQYGNYTFAGSGPENRLYFGVSSRFGAGLSNLSSVENARAQYEAALEEIEVQARAVSEQVLADYALARSAEVRGQALRASLAAALQVAASFDRQFLAGRKTWLDVMNAAREIAQTEVQIADLQAAQVVTTWRLGITTEGVAAVTAAPGALRQPPAGTTPR